MKQLLYLFTMFFCLSTLLIAREGDEAAPAPQSESVEVVVEGIAPIIDDNLTGAKKMARQDAYRRAVEEGTGVRITARTRMDMLMVVSDAVITKSEGYIGSSRILDEWRDNENNYRVKIQATVHRGDIHDDLEGLKILIDYVVGNPTVMILFHEENMGEVQLQSSAETEMSGIFSSAGYHLVEKSQVKSMKDRGEGLVSKILAGDGDSNTALSDLGSADIAIVGSVSTEEFSESYTSQAGLINAIAHASVKVVIPRTGQVIAARQSSGKSVHISAATAGSRAITNCVTDIAKQLVYEIPSRLSESRTVKITVRNCKYTQRNAIKEKLQKINTVSGVYPRSYEENTAAFDVKTWGDSERIAEYLDGMKNPQLKIITVNAVEVITEVVSEE